MFRPRRHGLNAMIVLGFALCVAAPAAFADTLTPALVVEGALLSNSGGPVADGKYAVQFKLYDAPDVTAQVLLVKPSSGCR